jgi:hypothetical protein
MRKLNAVFGQIVTSKLTHVQRVVTNGIKSLKLSSYPYVPPVQSVKKLCTLLHREFTYLNGIHNKETVVPSSELNGFSYDGDLFSARYELNFVVMQS